MSQHGYSPPSKMDPKGFPRDAEASIDLLIETLTGNTFEMTASPTDTIATLKSKIQRIEGIPMSAQHLLFNLSELEDNSKLSDCCISNGSTLRLVTSMRGGPISTRRVSPSPEERAWMDLVDSNRCDDLLQRLPSGQLTVLVFCEGEQLNLFRVVENVDGTYSPVTDSVNTSSMRNVLASDEPDAAARLRENTVTMGKMKELQRRLNNGIQRRKMKTSESAGTETCSTIIPPQESSSSTHTEFKGLPTPCKPQPSLQFASKLDPQAACTSSKQPQDQTKSSLRSIQSSLSRSSVSCPHRKLTSTRMEPAHFSQSRTQHPTPSRTFLPALSVSRIGKQDSCRQTSSSSLQSQPMRVPAPPRLIAPPLHVPPLLQRPPPLRLVLNQRQGPVSLPELKPGPALPKIHMQMKDEPMQYMPSHSTARRAPTMSRRRLHIITPQREVVLNMHKGMQQNLLHHQSNSQSDAQNGPVLRPGVASDMQKRNSLINVSNSVFIPNNVVVPQPATPLHGACHFILLRGPNSSPKERFTEYLTAYLTQSFSSRFSGMIPENLPVCLSHQLTKRLSHHFVGGLSVVAANRLSLQLSNRISQFLEECLSNRCPKDVLGQTLRSVLEERTAQGYPFIGGCRQADVWDPHMRVAVRGMPSFNSDVGANYPHCPDPTRDNANETREIFAQVPRFHSAPTPLTSPGASVRQSVSTGLQREPLFVRLNDSTMYQRGMVPVLVRPATTPNFPSPVFCNTVQTGPPSMEFIRRIIESSVPPLRQPRVQTEIQRDQSQVQIVNGIGRMTVPIRSAPPFIDPSQQPVFAGYQPPRVRWRTVRCTMQSNSQPRLQTETLPNEPQAGSKSGQGLSEQNLVQTESKLPKKSSPRCCQCRKKLTISNNYMCRCQKLFCSAHRYSEAHNCNFDYKEEGRKLLQQENPLVMAEKITRM